MLLVEQTASLRYAGKKRQERMPDDVRSSCWSPPTLYPPAHLDDPKMAVWYLLLLLLLLLIN